MTKKFTSRRPRGDRKISRLPKAQHAIILAYCEGKTLAEGTAWLQSQYNLTISTDGLSDWLADKRNQAAQKELYASIRESAECATIVSSAVGEAMSFPAATLKLLGQHLFEAMRADDLELVEKLLAIFTKLHESALADETVEIKWKAIDLARGKLELDQTQRAILKAPKIRGVIANSGLNQREKIEEVRKLLFCEATE